MTPDRMSELALHPTVKPIGMIADALKDCSLAAARRDPRPVPGTTQSRSFRKLLPSGQLRKANRRDNQAGRSAVR